MWCSSVLFCARERKEPVKDGMKVQCRVYRVIINKNNKYLVTLNTFITFILIDRRDQVTYEYLEFLEI